MGKSIKVRGLMHNAGLAVAVFIGLSMFILCLIPSVESTWNETTKDYQGYVFSTDAEWMMPNQDISNNFFIWESDFDAYDTLNPWSYSDNSHYLYAATYVDDWYEGIFGMTEPMNETSESGYYNITLICIYQTRSTGSTDCGYYFGYMLASGTSLMSDRYDAHNGNAFAQSFNHWEGNPDTGLPFTIDDLNDINIRILAYEDGTGTVTMKITRAILIAQPVAKLPEADFILRPDSDVDTVFYEDWEPVPDTPYSCWDKLDETTFHGDGSTTLITNPHPFTYSFSDVITRLTVENLPLNASSGYFTITIWAIAKCSEYQPDISTKIYIGVWNKVNSVPIIFGFTLSPSWVNYSHTFEINPLTGSSWTKSEVNSLDIVVYGSTFYDGMYMNVTQVAVIANYSTYRSVFLPITPIVIDDYFTVNMFGIIWLLAIFIPALALETQLSTIGFVAGAGLMLIVLNVALNGFFPVLIISLVGLGACFWGEKRG